MSANINPLDDAETREILTALAKLAKVRKAPDGEWLEFNVKFRMNDDGSVTACNMNMCVLEEVEQSVYVQ